MNEQYLTQVYNEDDDEINFSEYFRMLSLHKWSIIGLTSILTLLGTLIVFSMEPVYKATATISIGSESNIISIDEVTTTEKNRRFFRTQHIILRSRYLAEKTIDALNLTEHPLFDPKQQKPESSLLQSALSWMSIDFLEKESQEDSKKPDYVIRNSIVKKFMNHLEIALISSTQLVEITFESTDKELVALVPNTLFDNYINRDIQARLETTRKATDLITSSMGELKQNLEKSEKALQAFRDKEKLLDVGGVDSLTASELNQLTSKLIEARHRRTVAEETYKQIVSLQKQGRPLEDFESIPAILKDPSIRSAKLLQTQEEENIAELKKRYGAKHPKMIAAIDKFEVVNKNAEDQVLTVIESIKKEYEVTRAEEEHLSNEMRITKKGMNKLNRMTSELAALQRDVNANRSIYETFLSRRKETSVVSEMQPVHARIVDQAVIPSVPFKPKKKRLISIILAFSLILSIMMAFIIEVLDKTFKEPQDVEDRLRLSVLGLLPRLKIWLGKDVKVLRYYKDNSQSSFSENIRTIRSSVLLSEVDQKQKVILVTSSTPSEGKTVTALNLALSLGQISNVLLIDCDLRRPSIGKIFDFDSSNHVGLTDFIRGTHPLDQAVHHCEVEGINVIPVGALPPNPLEMLSSVRFAKALDALKKKFDHIVIDAPPAVVVSDAVVMSRLVNQVIYVIKADATTYPIVQDGIKRLQKVHAPIIGIVLNQINVNKQYYSYKYGYGYGHQD